jgi:hypothetical protein
MIISCDNSSDTLKKGTCKVSINGYVEKSLSGSAVFEEIPYYDRSYYFLVLEETDLPDGEYCYIQFNGSKLKKGTFELIDSENDESTQGKLIGMYAASDNYKDYCSTGGEIKVIYSSETELIGYFDFPAVGSICIGEGEYERVEIRISGEFYAVEGDVGIIIGKK